MLPFLDKKKAINIIIDKRNRDDLQTHLAEVIAPNDSNDPAMEAAAQDILRAIDQRDVSKLSRALKDAFQIADRDDSDEDGPHIELPDRGEM